MLNILFLTHRLPFPLDRGDRIRSYHMIRYLAQRHRVSLAAITDHAPDDAHIRHLETFCASVDVARIDPLHRRFAAACYLPTLVPLTLPLFASHKLKARIVHHLRTTPCDVIVIYCTAMAPYVLSDSSIPKVVDFIDADSQKWFDYARHARWPMKALYWREGALLRRYERRVADSCAHGFAASERDTGILRRVAPQVPITTLRNGVNLPSVNSPANDSHKLIFTGVMDYWPNIDAMTYFATEVLPLVRMRVPTTELIIVGQRPTTEVRRLGRLPGVTVTGWVADVTPYFASATVFVAPMRIARGVQNKLLEAMAAGVPVVCSSLGLGGIDALPGRDLLVADTPDLFSAHVVALLGDHAHRERLRHAATQFIHRHHRWEAQLNRLESVLVNVARRRVTDGTRA